MQEAALDSFVPLLRHALLVESSEGENALRLLRKKIASAGIDPHNIRLHDASSSAAIHAYKSMSALEGKLQEARAEISKLKDQIAVGGRIASKPKPRAKEAAPVAERKAPAEPFRWLSNPEAEVEACRMFMRAEHVSTIVLYVQRQYGHPITANQITQRMYNSPPPLGLIEFPKASGPTSWEELWLIAYENREKGVKGWRKGLELFGIPSNTTFTWDPNQLVDEDKLQKLRETFSRKPRRKGPSQA